MASTGGRTLRFCGASLLYAVPLLVGMGVMFGLGGWLLAAGLAAHTSTRGIGIGGGAVLLAVGAMYLTWTLAWLRGLAVDRERVRIARGLRSWTLDLSEIAGIGLIYQRTPGNSRDYAGWYLNIWTRNGLRYPVRQFFIATWASPKSNPEQRDQLRSFTARWPRELPVPNEDAAKLAHSRPGRIAARVAEAIARHQGTDGLLAEARLEKRQIFSPLGAPQLIAWWSPDGEMGRTI